MSQEHEYDPDYDECWRIDPEGPVLLHFEGDGSPIGEVYSYIVIPQPKGFQR